MRHSRFTIGVFLIMLVLFGAAALGAARSDAEVSENENRALAERPELTAKTLRSGRYFRAWDDFVADHVPHRDAFIRVAASAKALAELRRGVELIDVTADIGVAAGGDPKQSLIVLPDRLREVYRYDPALGAAYADAVNGFAGTVSEDVRVYAMLVPMPIEFETEAYARVSDPQKPAIDAVYGLISPRVLTADAYARIAPRAAAGDYVYFRTDHHWTALGAYYGMTAFAQRAGFEPLPLKAYRRTDIPEFLGYLYGMVPDTLLKGHPDTLSYYLADGRNNTTRVWYFADDGSLDSYAGRMIQLPVSPGDANYGIFLGGDSPIVEIEGDARNGRIAAVVKDSYGNALMPWLAPYFERVIGFDPRSFDGDFNAELTARGVTDLLIIDYTKATMLPAYIDALKAMTARR